MNSNSNTQKGKQNSATLTDAELHKIAKELRKKSRMSYLQNRSTQQLDLLKRRIEDEDKLFKGVRLSEDEIDLNKINKNIYNLVSEKINEADLNEARYNLPDDVDEEKSKPYIKDKKTKGLFDRYTEKNKEENEDEAWENAQKKERVSNTVH